MKNTVAVISFLSLVAFFHSCYGLKCYSCMSRNNNNPSCDNIVDDTHLIDYETSAQYCVWMDRRGKSDVLLRRSGLSSEAYIKFIREIEVMRRNFTVDFLQCEEDKCNKQPAQFYNNPPQATDLN